MSSEDHSVNQIKEEYKKIKEKENKLSEGYVWMILKNYMVYWIIIAFVSCYQDQFYECGGKHLYSSETLWSILILSFGLILPYLITVIFYAKKMSHKIERIENKYSVQFFHWYDSYCNFLFVERNSWEEKEGMIYYHLKPGETESISASSADFCMTKNEIYLMIKKISSNN